MNQYKAECKCLRKTNESCRTVKAIYKHKDVVYMFTLHKTSVTYKNSSAIGANAALQVVPQLTTLSKVII